MADVAPGAKPRLSLVVAAYDAARTLPALFASLATAGAGQSWEIVFVDNNSNDATPALLREFAARAPVPVTILREPRQGLGQARNTGLGAASGDIFAITDADCVLAPGYVDAVLAEFAADPALALLGGRVELHNPADLPISIRRSRARTEVTVDKLNFSEIAGCNTAFTRALIERVGPYDPGLGVGSGGACEDIDLVYRAARARLRIVYAPDVVVRHNHGRRTPDQYRATEARYAAGKGVFYMKYAVRLHRPILKAAYWDIAARLLELARSRASDDPSLGPAAALRLMAAGGLHRLAAELRGARRWRV